MTPIIIMHRYRIYWFHNIISVQILFDEGEFQKIFMKNLLVIQKIVIISVKFNLS